MKSKKMVIAVILIVLLIVNVYAQQGGENINNVEVLKEYLNNQPANSPDNPIQIAMIVNNAMIGSIAMAIRTAGKYVSLDLSKSTGLTIIKEEAFEDCNALVSITLPNNVTKIERQAFNDCAYLASVTIPASVTNIGKQAFQRCTNLNVTWYYNPELTTSEFKNYLKTVIIPESITSFKDGSMDSNSKYRGAFYGCDVLTNVTFATPSKVTSIGNMTFYGCDVLTNITIPDSVKSIGFRAFYDCKALVNITIPDSVTNIGNSAFEDCDSLTSVTFQGNISSSGINENAFSGIGDLRKKYLAGGPGTYTRPHGGSNTWTRNK